MIFPQFQCALALLLGKRAGGLAQVMNEINPVASDKLTFNRNALVLCFVSRESFMQLNNEHKGGGPDVEMESEGRTVMGRRMEMGEATPAPTARRTLKTC